MCGKAPISWCSKKQGVVALSSCEAEYVIALFEACQASWLSILLEEIGLCKTGAMNMLMENKSAMDLAKNHVAHGRSKHIETRYHFLRDQVNNEKMKLVHCKTVMQVADVLTKPRKKGQF